MPDHHIICLKCRKFNLSNILELKRGEERKESNTVSGEDHARYLTSVVDAVLCQRKIRYFIKVFTAI